MNLSHLANLVRTMFGNGANGVPTNGMPSQKKEAVDTVVNRERGARAAQGNK